MKKFAAGLATAGLLGMGGLGVGLGIAQADPHTPPPNPGNSDHGSNDGGQGNGRGNVGDLPDTVTGPGVNAGAPGNPLPPGHGFLPPPGHGGPMPQDILRLPDVPDWVTTPITPPEGAPPVPTELPDWAAGLNPIWDPDLNAWGVWIPDTNTFVRL
jgi:hypothetical protein